MIWQHKITTWKMALAEPPYDEELMRRQAEAKYDTIGADGWELVVVNHIVMGNDVLTWCIWKRPFIEKALAA